MCPVGRPLRPSRIPRAIPSCWSSSSRRAVIVAAVTVRVSRRPRSGRRPGCPGRSVPGTPCPAARPSNAADAAWAASEVVQICSTSQVWSRRPSVRRSEPGLLVRELHLHPAIDRPEHRRVDAVRQPERDDLDHPPTLPPTLPAVIPARTGRAGTHRGAMGRVRETGAMESWWLEPMRAVFGGRRVVLAGGHAAAWTEHIDLLRDRRRDRPVRGRDRGSGCRTGARRADGDHRAAAGTLHDGQHPVRRSDAVRASGMRRHRDRQVDLDGPPPWCSAPFSNTAATLATVGRFFSSATQRVVRTRSSSTSSGIGERPRQPVRVVLLDANGVLAQSSSGATAR